MLRVAVDMTVVVAGGGGGGVVHKLQWILVEGQKWTQRPLHRNPMPKTSFQF